VAEVGSGGGRVGALVAPKVQRLVCFDISEEMLKMARRSLEDLGSGDTLRIPRAGAMSRWAIYIDLS
jgi:predicted O-methyltransferase YrrM